MKENTYEKNLIQVNKNSAFYKIKDFFRNLFNKKENFNSLTNTIEITDNSINKETHVTSFIQYIKNIETEETKLLKLQKQYRSGEVNAKELTEEQIISLGRLYDNQIRTIKKSNEIRKQKLLEYRRKL